MSEIVSPSSKKSRPTSLLAYETGIPRSQMLARKMSNMFDIKVQYGPNACVDLVSNVIYIPEYNVYDEAQVIDAMHFIAHEVGHILYTDQSHLRGTKFRFFNILEDQRVNAKQESNWRFLKFIDYHERLYDIFVLSQKKLMKKYRELLDKDNGEEFKNRVEELMSASLMVNRFQNALLLKCHGVRSEIEIRREILTPLVYEKVKNDPDCYEVKWYEAFKTISHLCKQDWLNIYSSAFLEEDAETIYKAIEHLLPPDFEQFTQSSGGYAVIEMTPEEYEDFKKNCSSSPKGSGGLKVLIKVSDETKTDTDNMSGSSAGGDQCDSGDGEESGVGEGEHGADDGEENGTISDDMFSQALGKKMEINSNSRRTALFKNFDDIKFIPFPKSISSDSSTGHFREELRSKSKVFYNGLFDILTAPDLTDFNHGFKTGKLKKISKFGVTENLYSRAVDGESVEVVDVTLICDYSGSMGSYLETLSQVAGSLSLALSSLGVKNQVFGFSSCSMNEVYEVIPYGDPCGLRQLAYLRGSHGGGGTPMGEVLPYIMEKHVIPKKGTKKLVFILTDGEPNDSDAFTTSLDAYKKFSDIAFFGIALGSGARSLKRFLDDVIYFPDSKSFAVEGRKYFFGKIEKFMRNFRH